MSVLYSVINVWQILKILEIIFKKRFMNWFLGVDILTTFFLSLVLVENAIFAKLCVFSSQM